MLKKCNILKPMFFFFISAIKIIKKNFKTFNECCPIKESLVPISHQVYNIYLIFII